MPFTPPATYASLANTGYAAIFEIGTLASPPVFTAIAEIKSFTLPLISMSEISVTHLLSPNFTEEFIPSMIKPGKISASGNFIGDATQLSITTLAQAQSIVPVKIVAPVQRNGKTYTNVLTGFIASYEPGPFENNKPTEFKVEIQLTGAYTETVA